MKTNCQLSQGMDPAQRGLSGHNTPPEQNSKHRVIAEYTTCLPRYLNFVPICAFIRETTFGRYFLDLVPMSLGRRLDPHKEQSYRFKKEIKKPLLFSLHILISRNQFSSVSLSGIWQGCRTETFNSPGTDHQAAFPLPLSPIINADRRYLQSKRTSVTQSTNTSFLQHRFANSMLG